MRGRNYISPLPPHRGISHSIAINTKTTKTTKMKSFIVFALLVAAAIAAPAGPEADAQILRLENDNIGVDGYKYSVETSNGISQQEQGQLKNPGAENEAIEVRGQYSYPGPDGVIYTVVYIADENGFQPQGAHLPVPPQ